MIAIPAHPYTDHYDSLTLKKGPLDTSLFQEIVSYRTPSPLTPTLLPLLKCPQTVHLPPGSQPRNMAEIQTERVFHFQNSTLLKCLPVRDLLLSKFILLLTTLELLLKLSWWPMGALAQYLNKQPLLILSLTQFCLWHCKTAIPLA